MKTIKDLITGSTTRSSPYSGNTTTSSTSTTTQPLYCNNMKVETDKYANQLKFYQQLMGTGNTNYPAFFNDPPKPPIYATHETETNFLSPEERERVILVPEVGREVVVQNGTSSYEGICTGISNNSPAMRAIKLKPVQSIFGASNNTTVFVEFTKNTHWFYIDESKNERILHPDAASK